MRDSWSVPLPISEYLQAPQEKGIYSIGTSYIDSIPVIPGDSGDPYLGANFPGNFFLFYVGQSIMGESTIRSRISAHVHGRGNKHIGFLAALNYPLFLTTKVGLDAAEQEVLFLLALDPRPIFNKRTETSRSAFRLSRRVLADMPQSPWD